MVLGEAPLLSKIIECELVKKPCKVNPLKENLKVLFSVHFTCSNFYA